MKSWMTWNDIETPRSIRVYGASDYNKYENEDYYDDCAEQSISRPFLPKSECHTE